MAASAMSKRDERMAEVADKLERGFDLIGATAIEDKLQDDVDKAIYAMKKLESRFGSSLVIKWKRPSTLDTLANFSMLRWSSS